jgi:lysyl-tRNA synthetase class 2
MKTVRAHGGLTFIDFEDGTGKIQGLIAKNKVGEEFYKTFLEMFDVGDFIQARGTLFETKRGEKNNADC